MNRKKINLGWGIVLILSVLPFLLWLFASTEAINAFTLKDVLPSLGEIFGLIGIVTFSINLILTTRLKFIENLFGGLNNVYQKHNILGQISFVLLLFHPLLLIPRYSSSFSETMSFLLLSNSLGRNLGIISLLMMIVLIVLTLYLRPKYNIWKITHKFFGVALFLGALHVYFIPSYVMENLPLKIYVLVFGAIGILSFIYKTILEKYLVKKYEYKVEKINKFGENIIEIELKQIGEKIKYNAGQFIFISFKTKELSSESHPFSISSAPSDGYLKITVKNLGDYTKKLLNTLKQGDLAKIEKPYGVFSYLNSPSKKQIWVAGGIGITPFISFSKDLKNVKDYSIKLFYCVRSECEAVYLDQLKLIAYNKDNDIEIIPFYSKEKGRINAEKIFEYASDAKERDIFICAPPMMISALKNNLLQNGISKKNIYSEEFNF